MRPTNTPEELTKAYRAIAAIIVTVLVVGGTTVAVRASYGAFSDDIQVHTTFQRAGQALQTGSDVKYRGVNVGKVRSIDLVDRKVEVVLQVRKERKIPAATTAAVRSKTLFGEKYIELSVVDGDAAPYLEDGDEVRSGGTGAEVEELVDGTDRLLRSVDVQEVAVLMDELTEAAQGQGDDVAALIDKGVEASGVFADTIEAQEQALASLARFTDLYQDIGPQLNGISADLNELLPTFNAARADFERLLTTLRPFSDHLADFIRVNDADIDVVLDNGDNIVRVLTARKENISESIYGLYKYTYSLSNAVSPEELPDGSRFGYLKLFIDAGDLGRLLCAALGPTGPAAQLSAVREALAAAVPFLACDGDVGSGTAGTSGLGLGAVTGDDSAAAPTPGSDPAAGTGVPDPTQALTDLVAEQVGETDPSAATGGTGSLGAVLGPLLDGGS